MGSLNWGVSSVRQGEVKIEEKFLEENTVGVYFLMKQKTEQSLSSDVKLEGWKADCCKKDLSKVQRCHRFFKATLKVWISKSKIEKKPSYENHSKDSIVVKLLYSFSLRVLVQKDWDQSLWSQWNFENRTDKFSVRPNTLLGKTRNKINRKISIKWILVGTK
jgi:hypothetical protein